MIGLRVTTRFCGFYFFILKARNEEARSSEVLGEYVAWTLSGDESHQSGGNCQKTINQWKVIGLRVTTRFCGFYFFILKARNEEARSSEVLGEYVAWTLSGDESHQSGGNCQKTINQWKVIGLRVTTQGNENKKFMSSSQPTFYSA